MRLLRTIYIDSQTIGRRGSLINSRIDPSHPDLTSSSPWNSNLIIEHKNALYTANSTGVLSSIDRGETWKCGV